MVAITATNTATLSTQLLLSRARLEQARREADQAEANAQDLRAKADDAEQQAHSSRENVQKASAYVQNEEATYARASGTSAVPVKVQKLIEQMYTASNDKRAEMGNALKSNPASPSVVNSQGQKTGRIVNISA